MEKANYIGYDFMIEVYYLWDKGSRFGVKRNPYYTDNNGWISTRIWKTDRSYGQFKTILNTLQIKLKMSGKWNGQTKAEFDKNSKRIEDIINKSAGNKDKAIAGFSDKVFDIIELLKTDKKALINEIKSIQL